MTTSTIEEPLRSEVAQKMALDQVRYSEVWEDHELLFDGLAVQVDDDVLSIASGGSNTFALLLEEPRSITAIDMNPAQLHLMELKMAGIQELSHDEFLVLVGYSEEGDAREVYRSVRGALSSGARSFWDSHSEELSYGIYRCGRLDRYFEVFRREHLSRLWPAGLIERLFGCDDLEEQGRIVREEALTPEFREAFSTYYDRENMEKTGRDPAQFHYVEERSVGEIFLDRFVGACTELPLKGNFYVERFLTGRTARVDAGPLYLRPANFERLRGLMDRVTLQAGELETHLLESPKGAYSKANLSDVFEYMSLEATDRFFELLGERMRPGGRVAYWNLLIPRRSRTETLVPLDGLSRELSARDRAWFYREFFVDEVRGR